VERSARRRWTLIIVGLLVMQVIFGGVSVALALRGRGVVVEADYYNKAVHWDDHEALVQASQKLGWKADVRVGDVATSKGERALMITLRDKDGVPVEGARVEAAFFHRAAALDVTQVELKASGAGVYSASVPVNRVGVWEFRLTVHRAGAEGKEDVFVATLQRDLLE